MELVYVNGGKFLMGSYDGDLDEQPIHEIHLEDFYMGKFIVTQDQWQNLFKNLPKKIYHKGGNYPITEISWYEAIHFCNALSISEGIKPHYIINKFHVLRNSDSRGYRLPTEAEWEYASKGGMYSKNFVYAGSNSLDEVAWYVSNSNKEIHRVGLKNPNELGLHDMSGNVYEYCWDEYGPYPQKESFSSDSSGLKKHLSDIANIPEKSFKLPARVIRGGNCYGLPYRQRCTSRYRYQYIGYKHDFIGFRVARSN